MGESHQGKLARKERRRKFGWTSLSYTARVTLAFALIAAMTGLVAIGVISFVWEQHFQTYTASNMETLAETTASRIEERMEAELLRAERRLEGRARQDRGRRQGCRLRTHLGLRVRYAYARP